MVALDQDIRVDDIQSIVDAIRMIKHVAGVEPVKATYQEWMVAERFAMHARSKLYDAMNEALDDIRKGRV